MREAGVHAPAFLWSGKCSANAIETRVGRRSHKCCVGSEIIAEGVEKREQASYMLKLGCDEAQGYLFAKPMPYEQLLEFLASKDDN